MKLGYVTDYVGKPLFDARAREPGVVLYVRAVPTINKGETIASVGVIGRRTRVTEGRRLKAEG
jgi:hypothetical protein